MLAAALQPARSLAEATNPLVTGTALVFGFSEAVRPMPRLAPVTRAVLP